MNLQERLAKQKAKRQKKGTAKKTGQKSKPRIKKGKVMTPTYEVWSRFTPEPYPELAGSYERFCHTFGPEMSVLKELDFDGHERCHEGVSSKIIDSITQLFESGRIADVATYPKDAPISFITNYLLTGDTKYNKKKVEEILPDLEELGVNLQKPEIKPRDDPNLTGETEGYGDDDEEEEEDEE